MKTKIFALTFSLLIISPLFVSAAGIIPSDEQIRADGFCAFALFINTIINYFLVMSGVIATGTFTYAGARILLNPTNPGEIEKGKGMLIKTVIGIGIILLAWLAVYTVVSTFVEPGALRFLGNGSCGINNN